jgi:arylformamidase
MLLKGKKEINTDVAERIINQGFITIGTELETIGDNEVHSFLLGRNIGIIENLELRDVEEGEYFIFAPPVKVEGERWSFYPSRSAKRLPIIKMTKIPI